MEEKFEIEILDLYVKFTEKIEGTYCMNEEELPYFMEELLQMIKRYKTKK